MTGAQKGRCYSEIEKALLACREATRFGSAAESKLGPSIRCVQRSQGKPLAAVLLREREPGSPPPWHY